MAKNNAVHMRMRRKDCIVRSHLKGESLSAIAKRQKASLEDVRWLCSDKGYEWIGRGYVVNVALRYLKSGKLQSRGRGICAKIVAAHLARINVLRERNVALERLPIYQKFVELGDFGGSMPILAKAMSIKAAADAVADTRYYGND